VKNGARSLVDVITYSNLAATTGLLTNIMRILVTGASSPLAVGVLRYLLSNSDWELWCGRHRKEIPIVDPRIHVIDLDLESGISENTHFDLVVHFAGVTHASDEQQYWKINLEGTVRLAEAVRGNGCRRFVYISTRCASRGSGAYGESKLAAEQELQKLEWESLLIIRPAEIYGGGSNEGIDRMLVAARKWRIVPALFGHTNLLFAPMHVDDFCRLVAELIQQHQAGVRIETVCGPEDLNGIDLASRISKRYRAVPLPMWWPAVSVSLKALHKLGFPIIKPDQLTRLTGDKTGTATSTTNTPNWVRVFLTTDYTD
jgi:nucleoside-diphosphate-sugar epimerase